MGKGFQPYKQQIDWSKRYGVGSKRGTVPKESKLTKNIKVQLTEEEKSAIAEQKRLRHQEIDRESKRRMRAKRKIAKLATTMEGEFKKLTESVQANPDIHLRQPIPAVPDIKQVADSSGAGDDTAAMKMLSDMRWVYNQVDGKEKLLKLVKGDDKQFAFMVKELIKFETAVKEKEKGNLSGGANQNFFVIIKGLAEEENVKKQSGLQGDMIGDKLTITLNPDGEIAEEVPAVVQVSPAVIPIEKSNEPMEEEVEVSQSDTVVAASKEKLEW